MPNAVMWKAHSDLFPLANTSQVVEALETKYAYKRKPNRQGLCVYTNPILDVPYRLPGSDETVPGFKLLWVYGEVPYHVDAIYPPYTYHLILRSRNYMVVGKERPTVFEEDKVGDLIALKVFEPHALYHRKNVVSKELTTMSVRKPKNMWCSIVFETWAELDPERVYEAFRYALTFNGYQALRDSNQS